VSESSRPERAYPGGDQAVVTVLVKVPPALAFRIFTEEMDSWWRAGRKYRIGRDRSVVHLEPKLGGRLFETFLSSANQGTVVQTGTVTCWEPPARLVLEWQAVNFAPEEKTEVEVSFTPSSTGTLVRVCHRGWSRIRADHPVRHGQASAEFIRSMGMWWSDLLSSLRELSDH
jgi:uncharacterized protein YndB with AHSA1/START domain